jgi:uncharacterized protein
LTKCFAPELFASIDPLRLAGCRCSGCDTVQFPAVERCACCSQSDPVVMALPTRGSIHTWTTQRFAPKPPYCTGAVDFTAFVVGYVDLGEVLVEAPLLIDEAALEFGKHVFLVSSPVPGADAWSYAFSA